MTKIRFIGWQVGMRPIPFIKLLNIKAKLSLVESKKIKDGIVNNGEIFEIVINDDKIAQEILIEAQNLGVICELVLA